MTKDTVTRRGALAAVGGAGLAVLATKAGAAEPKADKAAGKSGASLIAGVAGTARPLGKFQVGAGTTVAIALPDDFGADHTNLAIKDCEIVAGILKQYPKEVAEMLAAVGAGRLAEAKKVAVRIGITEDNFTKQGGGMLALILLAIGCALLLAHD